MNNTTNTLPELAASGVYFPLAYICLVLSIWSAILFYWMYKECKGGKKDAEKIIENEFAAFENNASVREVYSQPAV